MDKLSEQLIDLQSRLAFQEDTLSHLNRQVAEQSDLIDRLQQQVRHLAEKYEDLRDMRDAGGESAQDEPPPHY